MCKMCSKLIIKTPERLLHKKSSFPLRISLVSFSVNSSKDFPHLLKKSFMEKFIFCAVDAIDNFEHILHLALVFLLLTLNMKLPAGLLQKRHSYKNLFVKSLNS